MDEAEIALNELDNVIVKGIEKLENIAEVYDGLAIEAIKLLNENPGKFKNLRLATERVIVTHKYYND